MITLGGELLKTKEVHGVELHDKSIVSEKARPFFL